MFQKFIGLIEPYASDEENFEDDEWWNDDEEVVEYE